MLAKTIEQEFAQALGLIPAHHNTRIAILQGLKVTLLCAEGLRRYFFEFQSNSICHLSATHDAKMAAKKAGHSVRCVHSVVNPESLQ